ncbi:MerR family transcriptional regulator [uncultured Zobellia sp.]|uniref:MerR family transcriptional regulator n=1 Tax=uncultured Zobellia sp. TaxID=255433 RepID=UPI00338E2F55
MKCNQRITKQELERMYGVNRHTIEVWRKRFGLPIIEISTHSKYIRREDLIEWENKMKRNNIIEM